LSGKIIKPNNPGIMEQLGMTNVCSTCRVRELKLIELGQSKVKLAGLMCPQCGNHFDEHGNHSKERALRWIYSTMQACGFTLPPKKIESLYVMARLKVSRDEATYMESIEYAIDMLKATDGRGPE